jgi:hypothetical protein
MPKAITPDSQRVSDYTSEESTPDAKQLQTVFRVSPREKRDKTFHARRSHKKSRGGCLTCKKRRVKVGGLECSMCWLVKLMPRAVR